MEDILTNQKSQSFILSLHTIEYIPTIYCRDSYSDIAECLLRFRCRRLACRRRKFSRRRRILLRAERLQQPPDVRRDGSTRRRERACIQNTITFYSHFHFTREINIAHLFPTSGEPRYLKFSTLFVVVPQNVKKVSEMSNWETLIQKHKSRNTPFVITLYGK